LWCKHVQSWILTSFTSKLIARRWPFLVTTLFRTFSRNSFRLPLVLMRKDKSGFFTIYYYSVPAIINWTITAFPDNCGWFTTAGNSSSSHSFV
jgi:hypothetical protein